jgi:type VI secretion system secreted protein VgrG
MADSRAIFIQTPLGPDALFLASFRGREQISQPFHFQLELMAENRQNVAFDKLLGQKVTISINLPDGKTKRFWNGICASLSQVGRDSTFTTYRMEVAPQLWLLSRRVQNRIFQYMSVPDILKKVLAGLEIKVELQGTFEARDYCVQYRESDFAFASRLMEEEGIYYFFKHADGSHAMVLGNSPMTHPAVLFAENAIYEELEGGNRPDMRVTRWEKFQEVRSGKVTLWDHCFELPGQHLDAERPTAESVNVGKVSHKLKLPANESLEIYEYPGGYARRFDGIDRSGGEQPAYLQKIFQDNKRTAAIRMEEEAAKAISVRGASNCRQFMTGHKFNLERHFDGDGAYVLTSVDHSASASAPTSGKDDGIVYNNHFTCIPLSLPFRPPQATPRPQVAGLQSAVVVGPPGEEIFTDKYGRVKVQFHWDRQGKSNADSSCWIRVATIWAGKGYGVIHIPRIGQEVVVDFMEGDPDQPIIVGSVYNAEQMPPTNLPAHRMHSGLRSASYPGSGGFNGMVCDDSKGVELVQVHSQFDMDTKVEHDLREHVLNNRSRDVTVNETVEIGVDQSYTIGSNRTIKVGSSHTETIGSSMTINVGTNLTETVAINYAETVGAAMELTVGAVMVMSIGAAMMHTVGAAYVLSVGKVFKETVGGAKSVSISAALSEKVGAAHVSTVTGPATVKAAKIGLTAKESIVLKTGSASIVMKSDGKITIKGTDITIKASGKVGVKAGGDVVVKGSKILEN